MESWNLHIIILFGLGYDILINPIISVGSRVSPYTAVIHPDDEIVGERLAIYNSSSVIELDIVCSQS